MRWYKENMKNKAVLLSPCKVVQLGQAKAKDVKNEEGRNRFDVYMADGGFLAVEQGIEFKLEAQFLWLKRRHIWVTMPEIELGTWQHADEHHYQVLGVAWNFTTESWNVLYVALYAPEAREGEVSCPTMFLRPLDRFQERFTYLGLEKPA